MTVLDPTALAMKFEVDWHQSSFPSFGSSIRLTAASRRGSKLQVQGSHFMTLWLSVISFEKITRTHTHTRSINKPGTSTTQTTQHPSFSLPGTENHEDPQGACRDPVRSQGTLKESLKGTRKGTLMGILRLC